MSSMTRSHAAWLSLVDGSPPDLFPGRDPVGETLRIRGVPFAVIGVLDERGSGLDPFNEDEAIFVPLRVAQRRIFQVDYVQRFFARVDEERIEDGAAAIRSLLASRYRSSGPNPPVFRVQDQRRLVEVRDEGAARLRAFQREVFSRLAPGIRAWRAGAPAPLGARASR
jgi:putative ABC transport system permease protein